MNVVIINSGFNDSSVVDIDLYFIYNIIVIQPFNKFGFEQH
jgi:hypothetical protein